MNLHLIDWVIIVGFFGAAIGSVIWTQQYIKSAADFLAGSRCAGRYLLTVSGTGMFGAIGVVAAWECTYQVGFGAGWWSGLAAPVALLVTMTGWVIYRFRQTRALTLAQFFEVRYSRGFRVYAGVLGCVSGIINYGVFPSIAARFFIYLCGIPEFPVTILGVTFSITYPAVMLFLTIISLWITLGGGQVSIMVCDFVMGVLFMGVGVFLSIWCLKTFGWDQIGQAFQNITNPDTNSMVNPFKTSGVKDFNVWFYLIGIFGYLYSIMAWQGTSAFSVAPKSPHEARMAGILGQWRAGTVALIVYFLAICAFTVMHHVDFAQIAERSREHIAEITNPAVQKQMTVPIVLGQLMPAGLLGMLCAVLVVGAVTTDDSYLHSWGSIFVQDIILPLRKKPFTPQEHIRTLRWSITGVAVFAYFFSLFFRQTDYILMFFALTGAIFLGGAGSVIIGGLYWKRGTAAGAWAAMTVGSVLAFSSALIGYFPYAKITMTVEAPQATAVTVNDQPARKGEGGVWTYRYKFWSKEDWQSARVLVTTPAGTTTNLVRYAFGSEPPRKSADELVKAVSSGKVNIQPGDLYFAKEPPGFLTHAFVTIRSINGQLLFFYSMVSAILVYIVVSLLQNQVFDMDRMLHRGKYAIKSDSAVGEDKELPPLGWKALIGMTTEFTRGDKILYIGTWLWSLLWIGVFFYQLIVNLIQVQSDDWWLWWNKFSFYVNLAIGFVTTFWIGLGGLRDMGDLFRTLRDLKRNYLDDGRVVNHHNVGESETESPADSTPAPNEKA
jgi:SSS family solute:Na+ symporter